MHYWNKGNFQGLKELAIELRAHAQFDYLADYCHLREQGLRREAFAALDQFLAETAGWNKDDARKACLTILDFHLRAPEVHQFVTHPLERRFLVPTLEGWVEEEPEAALPLRWLGVLTCNADLVRRALAACPEDIIARRYLVNHHLAEVDHVTHHLVESRLLGDLDATRSELSEARVLLDAGPQPAPLEDLYVSIQFYEGLLSDWAEYQTTKDGSFPEWCQRRGRQYEWPSIVYYR